MRLWSDAHRFSVSSLVVSSLGEVKRRVVSGPVVVFALPVASPPR